MIISSRTQEAQPCNVIYHVLCTTKTLTNLAETFVIVVHKRFVGVVISSCGCDFKFVGTNLTSTPLDPPLILMYH